MNCFVDPDFDGFFWLGRRAAIANDYCTWFVLALATFPLMTLPEMSSCSTPRVFVYALQIFSSSFVSSCLYMSVSLPVDPACFSSPLFLAMEDVLGGCASCVVRRACARASYRCGVRLSVRVRVRVSVCRTSILLWFFLSFFPSTASSTFTFLPSPRCSFQSFFLF